MHQDATTNGLDPQNLTNLSVTTCDNSFQSSTRRLGAMVQLSTCRAHRCQWMNYSTISQPSRIRCRSFQTITPSKKDSERLDVPPFSQNLTFLSGEVTNLQQAIAFREEWWLRYLALFVVYYTKQIVSQHASYVRNHANVPCRHPSRVPFCFFWSLRIRCVPNLWRHFDRKIVTHVMIYSYICSSHWGEIRFFGASQVGYQGCSDWYR